MGLRFTVLASGSSGNASLVQVDGFGALIDVGIGPRQFAARLAKHGLSWANVQAVLLTHTHTDHWKEATLTALVRHRIPFYCHPGHHISLRTYSDAFMALEAAKLVNTYVPRETITLRPGLCFRPLPVSHDGGPTFGFRFEGAADLFGRAPALGYVADLGCWDDALVTDLADVNLLAVEFNHDVGMQHASGRAQRLIDRILGDYGHLSNEQAAQLVQAVVVRSEAGRLRHLVQLHLSRECNRRHLAQAAARSVLETLPLPIELHTASQDVPGKVLDLATPRTQRRASASRRTDRPASVTPIANGWLPGLEESAPPGPAAENS
jgi:phosphoribosyl 1,2-cyclic phosphodiesterase